MDRLDKDVLSVIVKSKFVKEREKINNELLY